MQATYELGQWLRRISGDHDTMIASQKQIDREVPKPLTEAEVQEGLSL